MTENQIVEKLRRVLSEEVQKEADVVYLLAECRKLLEDTKTKNPHFALKFYCHWALHVDLSGRDTTLPLLKRVDSYVQAVLNDHNFGEQRQMAREFAFMYSFRQALKEFLESHTLPTQLCDDKQRWHQFLSIYASVIEEGSMTCNAQPGDLKLVSRVTFKKGRPADGCHLPFDMEWDIHLVDKRILTVSVRAPVEPPDAEMLFTGIHLH